MVQHKSASCCSVGKSYIAGSRFVFSQKLLWAWSNSKDAGFQMASHADAHQQVVKAFLCPQAKS
jgi:hypothetical protein